MFLACCVLPDKKPYGNRLYWCKYIRDISGATQRLKATVPDRRIWLPAPACVIVAVRRAGLRWGQRGQLPRAPRCKGAHRDEIYLFQIKYSFEKFLWFRGDTRIQLYIIFVWYVKYQEPPTAADFSTRGVSNSFSLRTISTLWLPWKGQLLLYGCPQTASCNRINHNSLRYANA